MLEVLGLTEIGGYIRARRHDIPCRASARNPVERGEFASERIGVLIGRRRCGNEADMGRDLRQRRPRSEEQQSELQSSMRITSPVFCLKKKKTKQNTNKL